MTDVATPIAALPRWVVVGVAVGLIASLLGAALFVVAGRLFPTEHRPRREDGDRRRRAEIRAYLRQIGEPFAEEHAVAGHRVAFYLPERDVAITFDAEAFYGIERTGSAAVLVEHEMPGAHLADRLPFETPAVEPADREEPDAPFAVLGLPASATASEVERAYRERVMEVHPDKGGDERAFRRVREAYAIAKERAE